MLDESLEGWCKLHLIAQFFFTRVVSYWSRPKKELVDEIAVKPFKNHFDIKSWDPIRYLEGEIIGSTTVKR